MFQILLVSALVAFACGLPQSNRPHLDGRIVGGEAVEITDVPYQVSVLISGTHICGGVIVGWNICLTAAHCTDAWGHSSLVGTTELSVRVGSSILNEGGKVYRVSRYIQHPEYDSHTMDSDMSILFLADEISFGPGINTIALPPNNQPAPAGAASIVSGWGATSPGGPPAQQLQRVVVYVVGNDECVEDYGPGMITDNMMCAEVSGEEKDPCYGDNGGPLVVDGVLMGIVAWGFGCALPDFPGVYTSVPAMRSFIKEAANI